MDTETSIAVSTNGGFFLSLSLYSRSPILFGVHSSLLVFGTFHIEIPNNYSTELNKNRGGLKVSTFETNVCCVIFWLIKGVGGLAAGRQRLSPDHTFMQEVEATYGHRN